MLNKRRFMALVLVALVFLPGSAFAQTSCDGVSGDCEVVGGGGHEKPGNPGDSGDAPGKGGRSGGGKRVCTYGAGTEVPCETGLGTWVDSREMWCQPASTQPPKTDPVWKGNRDCRGFG